MQLARMDDVAGCRLIFPNVGALREFRANFHGANFKHRRKNEIDKYDYIMSPKPLGYRGIHDIYEYETTSIQGTPYKGLLLELQYRTHSQHAWATSVELMKHLTGNEPKFNRGDAKHIEFFKLASEVIARTQEDLRSSYPDLSDAEVSRNLRNIDGDIKIMAMLRQMPTSGEDAQDAKEFILHMSEGGGLTIHEFQGQGAATAAYFKLEKDYPGDDIVMVRADTFASIRSAYRNYFSDVTEFIRFIDDGCRALESSASHG